MPLVSVAGPGSRLYVPSSTISGLDFPSNGASPSSAFVAFQFLNPHLDGLPICGPANAGVTYIFKVRPRQQTGYYTTFFWANTGPNGLPTFLWDDSKQNTYVGCQPYPADSSGSPLGETGTEHQWEISCNAPIGHNNDVTETLAGNRHAVVYDEWRTQAARVVRNANGTKTITFYVDLPSVANADVIQFTVAADRWETNPPNPALTFGDAPWQQSLERLSGILRDIEIYDTALSQADILLQAASDSLLPANAANIWWKKLNPTPNDLLCDAGTGRSPTWASATKASLWGG